MLPFPVLSDSDGKVTDLYLEHPEEVLDKTFDVASFLADRWGALFSTIRIEIDHELPVEAEVREWLEFIELQCEECFPSELAAVIGVYPQHYFSQVELVRDLEEALLKAS